MIINDFVPKKKNHQKWLLFGLPLLLVLAVGIGIFWYRSNLNAPSKEATQKVFVIAEGESVKEIADRLEKEGLIKSSLVFRIYLRLGGEDINIQTGDFKLRTDMTSPEIAQTLATGVIDIWVTLLEGWRVEEMGKELKRKLGVDEEAFINNAQEGYMFPDTYLLPKEATAVDIITILKNNFDRRLKDNDLTASSGTKELTFAEKVILASILERESKDGLEERSTIAGILLNRLKLGMALQVDATIQYDLGHDGNWWPLVVPQDYEKDTPYSTYAHPGLPPGPICNPGIDSLKAAFNPTASEYLYYLHGTDGKVYYAKTLEEHNQNKGHTR